MDAVTAEGSFTNHLPSSVDEMDEAFSSHFSSSFITVYDLLFVSRPNDVASFHVDECTSIWGTSMEPIIIVPDFNRSFSDIDNGYDMGCSANNILSLEVWNEPNSLSDEACSPVWDN